MKNIIVFGVARSGTTYVNQLVARYLWEAYDNHYTIFNEFFNRLLCKHITRTIHETHAKMPIEKTEDRIMNTMDNYTFDSPMLSKLHSGHLSRFTIKKNIFDFINRTADVILVERDDIMDQVLSLALARRTGIWGSPEEVNSYELYKVLQMDFAEISLGRDMLRNYKKLIPEPIGLVKYDDINKLGGIEILRKLGFDDENILSKLDLSDVSVKLIEKEQKWELLFNKEEAEKWYELYFGEKYVDI